MVLRGVLALFPPGSLPLYYFLGHRPLPPGLETLSGIRVPVSAPGVGDITGFSEGGTKAQTSEVCPRSHGESPGEGIGSIGL